MQTQKVHLGIATRAPKEMPASGIWTGPNSACCAVTRFGHPKRLTLTPALVTCATCRKAVARHTLTGAV